MLGSSGNQAVFWGSKERSLLSKVASQVWHPGNWKIFASQVLVNMQIVSTHSLSATRWCSWNHGEFGFFGAAKALTTINSLPQPSWTHGSLVLDTLWTEDMRDILRAFFFLSWFCQSLVGISVLYRSAGCWSFADTWSQPTGRPWDVAILGFGSGESAKAEAMLLF